MSLADPQSITISGTAISLPRTSVGDDRSEYTSGDGLNQLILSHTYGKRTRRMLRFDTSKLAPDPYRTADNVKRSMSVYTVFDLPDAGYDAVQALAVYAGYKALIAASSDVAITKLLGGES